ncbi:MAG: RnfABCDGE type electron transport complex subunit D [Tepidisphaerales bacterium]
MTQADAACAVPEAVPTPAVPPAVLQDRHPSPTHCGVRIGSLYGWMLPALLPPLLAGVMLFGWRAAAMVLVVVLSTLAGAAGWKRVGQRGRSMRMRHALVLGLLLAMLMPAEAFRTGLPWWSLGAGATWPMLVGAGLLLSLLYWLFGGVGTRLHPVAATALVLLIVFPGQMTATAVLGRPHLWRGDVLSQMPAPTTASDEMHLRRLLPADGPQALRMEPASETLTAFMRSTPTDGIWLSLDGLIRELLPPLEDLIIGGHPMPVGLASMCAVLLGGLFLLYRGLADWRIPLVMLLSGLVALLCLRLPVVVTADGPEWRWLAFREHGMTWETMLTFGFYQLAAGPMVFVAFFLATDSASAPATRGGRILYALGLGVLAAAGQLYLSVATGALVALLVMSLLTPWITRLGVAWGRRR